MVHPTAIVSSSARVGAGVTIGPHAIVEADTEVGDNCMLHASCVLHAGTILATGVVVHPFATLGGPPQYLKFDPATRSGVRVGAGTVIREAVTINRSIRSGEFTTVGEQCFLMANSHVAHDCALGDRVILANGALLAGHVTVGADVFFGGGCALHQFTRVGEGAIIGGLAAITFDVPPYVMVADRNRLAGFNLVGLRRRGVPRATIAELKALFSRVYAASNPKQEAAAALSAGAATTTEGRRFLEFFGAGKRGIVRPRRGPGDDDEENAAVE